MQHLAALANSLESLMFNTTVALERSALNSGFESEEHIHIPHSLSKEVWMRNFRVTKF